MKLDTKINLQHLVLAVISIIASIVIWGFTLKSNVDMNTRDILQMKENTVRMKEKLEQQYESIQESLTEIKLELKDKADRSNGN